MNIEHATSCPDWCTTNSEPDHWTSSHGQLPREAVHTRTFGDLVTLSIGHQIDTDGHETWETPTLAIDPDQTELQNGPSMLWTDEAAALAGHLQAATAFALALEAVTAQAMPGVSR